MKLSLFHRHYGIHSLYKEVEIDLKFSDVVKNPTSHNEDFFIDEFSIFLHIPVDFLPVDSRKCLLCVGHKHGSIAQRNPSFFRPWGKYFDSYSLQLAK